ncbi:hypothetical protein AB0B66_18500 [Catellatospora sp. NPDC049111]
MRAGDEAMAGVEQRLAEAVGQDDYRAFKRTLQRLAELSTPEEATPN